MHIGTLDEADAVWCYPEAMDESTSRGFRTDYITGGRKAWLFGSETTHLTFANTYPDAEAATCQATSSTRNMAPRTRSTTPPGAVAGSRGSRCRRSRPGTRERQSKGRGPT